jgi:hypothetical protein
MAGILLWELYSYGKEAVSGNFEKAVSNVQLEKPGQISNFI